MASPPFNINQSEPGDSDFIRLFPQSERLFRDIVESWLSLEHDATTGRHKIPIDTTANLAALTFATGSMRYDNTFFALQFNRGGGVWSTINMPHGVTILARTSDNLAPRGYLKGDIGTNGWSVKVTNDGSASDNGGGGLTFDQVFTNRTIAQANLPNVNFTVSGSTSAVGNHSHGGATGFISNDHTHFFSASTSFDGDHAHTPQSGFDSFVGGNPNQGSNVVGASSAAFPSFGFTNTTGAHTHTVSGSTGGVSANHNHTISFDGAHSHSVSGTAASGGSGTALNFTVARLGFILLVKNAND